MSGTRCATVLALALLVAAGAAAGTRHQRMQLRVPPELELEGTEQVFVGPIMLEPGGDDPTRRVDYSSVEEFEEHVRRLIRRQTRLNLLPADEALRAPVEDPTQLMEMRGFWTELGRSTGAEYIVAAGLDVEVLDRAGYQTEEYVSPEDGRTYYRQVMVEETGFRYDILLIIVNGATGEVVHEEQITDFKPRHERKLDTYEGMFDDLYTLENRLLGIFVPRMIRVKRYLYTG